MRTSTCKGCQSAIIWAATRAGSSAPFDADPSPKGNFSLRQAPTATTPVAVFVSPAARVEGELLYLNHFVSCPRRESFKR